MRLTDWIEWQLVVFIYIKKGPCKAEYFVHINQVKCQMRNPAGEYGMSPLRVKTMKKEPVLANWSETGHKNHQPNWILWKQNEKQNPILCGVLMNGPFVKYTET